MIDQKSEWIFKNSKGNSSHYSTDQNIWIPKFLKHKHLTTKKSDIIYQHNQLNNSTIYHHHHILTKSTSNFKHARLWSDGQAEYPSALWSHAWHGWHTSWCPQTDPQGRPQQPPAEPKQRGSGNADQSATKHRFTSKDFIQLFQYKSRFISSDSTLKSCAISRTSLWNGSFLIKSSVLFWYLRISLLKQQQD